jgi:hypothetical protein
MSGFGPSFDGELQAAGLSGLSFWWSPSGQYDIGKLTEDQQAEFRAVAAAHDPTKPGPPTGPVPYCSKLGLKRAFEEKGLWPTVRAMIAGDADMAEDWGLAIEIRITDPIVAKARAGLAQQGIALSDADVLALVNRANELVA